MLQASLGALAIVDSLSKKLRAREMLVFAVWGPSLRSERAAEIVVPNPWPPAGHRALHSEDDGNHSPGCGPEAVCVLPHVGTAGLIPEDAWPSGGSPLALAYGL